MENTIENEQLANFKVFKNALSTFKTNEIVNLFAPDFEISTYGGKQILKFENGFQKDLNSNTKLISFISDNLKGLKSLLNPNFSFVLIGSPHWMRMSWLSPGEVISLSSKLGGRLQGGIVEANDKGEEAHPGTEERTPEIPKNWRNSRRFIFTFWEKI